MRGMARHLARHIAQVAAKSSANGSNLCETNSFKYPFAGLRTLRVCVCKLVCFDLLTIDSVSIEIPRSSLIAIFALNFSLGM